MLSAEFNHIATAHVALCEHQLVGQVWLQYHALGGDSKQYTMLGNKHVMMLLEPSWRHAYTAWADHRHDASAYLDATHAL